VDIFKWGGTSLSRHVTLWELLFSFPLFLISMFQDYSENTLTLAWVLRSALVAAIVGCGAGVFVWYVVVLPFVKGKHGRR
jgi:ABC-type proline/glycine betaine transport system permease subunit